jgi:hypothetical protein
VASLAEALDALAALGGDRVVLDGSPPPPHSAKPVTA